MKQSKWWVVMAVLGAGGMGAFMLLTTLLTPLVAAGDSGDGRAFESDLKAAVNYRLPGGYGDFYFGFPLLIKGVMMGPSDQQSTFSIVLVQSPFLNESNGEEFARGLHCKYKSTTLNVDWHVVGTTPVLINGKFINMIVKEGNSSSGYVYHSVSTVLDGGRGKVVLVASGLANQWDQGAFNALVQSITY